MRTTGRSARYRSRGTCLPRTCRPMVPLERSSRWWLPMAPSRKNIREKELDTLHWLERSAPCSNVWPEPSRYASTSPASESPVASLARSPSKNTPASPYLQHSLTAWCEPKRAATVGGPQADRRNGLKRFRLGNVITPSRRVSRRWINRFGVKCRLARTADRRSRRGPASPLDPSEKLAWNGETC